MANYSHSASSACRANSTTKKIVGRTIVPKTSPVPVFGKPKKAHVPKTSHVPFLRRFFLRSFKHVRPQLNSAKLTYALFLFSHGSLPLSYCELHNSCPIWFFFEHFSESASSTEQSASSAKVAVPYRCPT